MYVDTLIGIAVYCRLIALAVPILTFFLVPFRGKGAKIALLYVLLSTALCSAFFMLPMVAIELYTAHVMEVADADSDGFISAEEADATPNFRRVNDVHILDGGRNVISLVLSILSLPYSVVWLVLISLSGYAWSKFVEWRDVPA